MTEIRSAVDFYARHPISAEIILAKLKEARGADFGHQALFKASVQISKFAGARR